MIGFMAVNKDLYSTSSSNQYAIGTIYGTDTFSSNNSIQYGYYEMPFDLDQWTHNCDCDMLMPKGVCKHKSHDPSETSDYLMIQVLGEISCPDKNSSQLYTRKIQILKKLTRKELVDLIPVHGEVITPSGEKFYFKNKKFHRDTDLPAVIRRNGDMRWYYEGMLHRSNDKPALVDANGYKEWYYFGQYHRDLGLPAVMATNGYMAWYQKGKLHRSLSNPALVYVDESPKYFKNGKEYIPDDKILIKDPNYWK
jgi:hypothetical protein